MKQTHRPTSRIRRVVAAITVAAAVSVPAAVVTAAPASAAVRCWSRYGC